MSARTASLAAAVLLCAAGCGPGARRLALGKVTPAPAAWSTELPDGKRICEIEARPDDPHSVQLECFVYDGQAVRAVAPLGARELVAGRELGGDLDRAPGGQGAPRRRAVRAARGADHRRRAARAGAAVPRLRAAARRGSSCFASTRAPRRPRSSRSRDHLEERALEARHVVGRADGDAHVRRPDRPRRGRRRRCCCFRPSITCCVGMRASTIRLLLTDGV